MNYQQYGQPMGRMYPQYTPQTPSVMPPQQSFMTCQPVSSIEEVKAARIALDGTKCVFMDVTNGKIYTKCINLDGVAEITAYSPEPIQSPEDKIDERLRKVESAIIALKGEIENVQSKSDNANVCSCNGNAESNASDDAELRE